MKSMKRGEGDMSKCVYCRWIKGVWRCSHPRNKMEASEYCTSDEFCLEDKLDYCADYEER